MLHYCVFQVRTEGYAQYESLYTMRAGQPGRRASCVKQCVARHPRPVSAEYAWLLSAPACLMSLRSTPCGFMEPLGNAAESSETLKNSTTHVQTAQRYEYFRKYARE
jgi:hypothetical protein